MTSDRDRHEGFELLQEDVAQHQRAHQGEVTAEANRVFLAGEMERVEQMLAAQPTLPAAEEAPALPPPPTVERRQVDGRQYLLARGPDRPLLRTASPLEAEFFVKASARCALLMELGDGGPLGAPSWRDRLLAVMATKGKAAAWTAAAQAPNELAETRRTCERDQRLLKLLGLETINELTPAFCRAKAAECERQYLFELVEVLDDSNALGFGDWKADPPKPVTQQVIA